MTEESRRNLLFRNLSKRMAILSLGLQLWLVSLSSGEIIHSNSFAEAEALDGWEVSSGAGATVEVKTGTIANFSGYLEIRDNSANLLPRARYRFGGIEASGYLDVRVMGYTFGNGAVIELERSNAVMVRVRVENRSDAIYVLVDNFRGATVTMVERHAGDETRDTANGRDLRVIWDDDKFSVFWRKRSGELEVLYEMSLGTDRAPDSISLASGWIEGTGKTGRFDNLAIGRGQPLRGPGSSEDQIPELSGPDLEDGWIGDERVVAERFDQSLSSENLVTPSLANQSIARVETGTYSNMTGYLYLQDNSTVLVAEANYQLDERIPAAVVKVRGMGEAFASALGIELFDGATRVASLEVDTNSSAISYLFNGDRQVDVVELRGAEDSSSGLLARDMEIELTATETLYRVILADGTVEERRYPAIGTGMNRLRLFSGFNSAINKHGRIDHVRIETADGETVREWDFADASQLEGWILPEPIYVMETATAADGLFATHLILVDNDPADSVLGGYRFGGKFASGEVRLALALQGDSGGLRLMDGSAETGRIRLNRSQSGLRLEMNGYYQSAQIVSSAASMADPLWVSFRWGNQKLRIMVANASGDLLYDRTMMFSNADATPEWVAFEAGGLLGSAVGTRISVADLSIQLGTEVQPLTHPHILLSSGEFGEWRMLMSNSPWQEVGHAAISAAPNVRYDRQNDPVQANKAGNLLRVFSLNSLAYILDDVGRSRYVTNVRRAFEVGMADLITNHTTGSGWGYEVPVNTAIMYGILALDIMDAAYTEEQVAQYAGMLRVKIAQQVNIAEIRGVEAVAALMAFYEGDWPRFQELFAQHTAKLRRDIGLDGVYLGGSTYGWTRMTSRQRAAKHMLDDILTVNGRMDTYADSLLQKAHTWLTGYALTPFGHYITYGDSNYGMANLDVLGWRSALFSDEAASFLAYHAAINLKEEMIPAADLMAYAIARSDLREIEPRPAPSRLFDSQAALRGRTGGRDAMYGHLFSPVAPSGHAKFEVNSMELGAFGEKLLLNSGYPAWGSDWGGFTWDWFHFDSESNNVVEFNDSRHASVAGGGIRSGLFADWAGFATGLSGDAITAGSHARTLVQIERVDGNAGYWVVVDELAAQLPDSNAQLILHPNSGAVTTLVQGFQYSGEVRRLQSGAIPVGPEPLNLNGAGLHITLGVEPDAVHIRTGAHANGATSIHSFITEYIVADYAIEGTVPKRLVSVFSPTSTHNPPLPIERHTVQGATLLRADGAVATDWLLLNQPGHSFDSNQSSIDSDGAFAMVRSGNTGVRHLMIDGSYVFNWTNQRLPHAYAIQSSAPVSLIQQGRRVQLIADRAVIVDFYFPMIRAIISDDTALEPIAAGDGWMRCSLAPGSHRVEIIANGIFGSFDAVEDVENDWYRIANVGWLRSVLSQWPYVFHPTRGWLYLAEGNSSDGHFLWHADSSSWLFLLHASNWAYDYSQSRWLQL